MTHIIVATHGKFSEELVNSAAMVYGEDENTHVVTFLLGEGGEHLVEKYKAIIATLPENEPVLFLVDLFGGSPYNAASRVATVRFQIRLCKRNRNCTRYGWWSLTKTDSGSVNSWSLCHGVAGFQMDKYQYST